MAVYRLRKNQRGPKCSYCDAKAVHRGCYFRKFACTDHISRLVEDDALQMEVDAHETEAEFFIGLTGDR